MKDPSSPKRKPKKTWYISHYSGSHYGGFHGIVMHLSSTCPFQPNSSQLASSRWFLEDLPKKTELHASVDDARKHQKDDSTCVFHMLGTWPLQGTSKRPVKSDTRKILEHWLSGWLFGWYLLVTATQGLFIGHGWFDLHGLWDFPYLRLSWIRVPTTLQPFFQHTFKRPNRQS